MSLESNKTLGGIGAILLAIPFLNLIGIILVLIAMKGIGPNIVRALALISDLIYGDKPSWQDPIKYSFTVGGKDGVPFPVDRKAMDESTEIIKTSIEHAKIGNRDKIHAIKRLREFISPNFKKYYT